MIQMRNRVCPDGIFHICRQLLRCIQTTNIRNKHNSHNFCSYDRFYLDSFRCYCLSRSGLIIKSRPLSSFVFFFQRLYYCHSSLVSNIPLLLYCRSPFHSNFRYIEYVFGKLDSGTIAPFIFIQQYVFSSETSGKLNTVHCAVLFVCACQCINI